MSGGFPSQRVSNTENVSIWWRYHDELSLFYFHSFDRGWTHTCPWVEYDLGILCVWFVLCRSQAMGDKIRVPMVTCPISKVTSALVIISVLFISNGTTSAVTTAPIFTAARATLTQWTNPLEMIHTTTPTNSAQATEPTTTSVSPTEPTPLSVSPTVTSAKLNEPIITSTNGPTTDTNEPSINHQWLKCPVPPPTMDQRTILLGVRQSRQMTSRGHDLVLKAEYGCLLGYFQVPGSLGVLYCKHPGQWVVWRNDIQCIGKYSATL